MSTIIAETYILEIKAWQSLIMFYKKQLDVLKHKLYQAFNTPVLIKDSARLENYQVHIIAIQDYLYEIETSIQKQYDKIDSCYLFDDLNKNEIIEREQLLLRYKMYITEKKYLRFRYNLSQYLISIFEDIILFKFKSNLFKISSNHRRSTNITV